jgi:hypothetical protein
VKLRTGAVSESSHPIGVRFSLKHIPGVARFARSPRLICFHAFGVENAAREGCEKISPGLSEAKPGCSPTLDTAPRRGARTIWTALLERRGNLCPEPPVSGDELVGHAQLRKEAESFGPERLFCVSSSMRALLFPLPDLRFRGARFVGVVLKNANNGV